MSDDQFDAAVEEAVAAATAEQRLVELERLRKSVLKERRLLRILTALAIIVGSFGAVEGLAAKDALNEFRDSRASARKVGCVADNDTADRINGLNDRTQDLLRDAVAGGDRTPEEQAQALKFLAEQLDKYEALKVPRRDCSDGAIDSYYGQ